MQLRIYIVTCGDPLNCVAAGHACKQDVLKNTGIYEVSLPSIHSRGKFCREGAQNPVNTIVLCNFEASKSLKNPF